MSAGKPIIALAKASSELAQTVANAKCGWVIEPGSPEALACRIREAINLNSIELNRIGIRGLQYCRKVFSATKCLERLSAIIYQAGSA